MKKIFATKPFKIFCLAFIFLVIFFVRLSMLKKSIYPNGLDGFYYALQSKSLVQTGALENPDLECGYYLCGLCSLICGDSILGVKIWSALSSAFLSLSIFVLTYILMVKSCNRFLISIFGMLISSASLCTGNLTINYINNQTGLFFLLLYAASLIFLLRIGGKSKWFLSALIFSIALFLLSVFSHKVSGIYALVFTGAVFAKRFFFEKKLILPKSILIALPVVIFSSVVFVLINQRERFVNTFDFPSLPIFHKNIMNLGGDFALPFSLELSLFFIFAWVLFFFSIIVKGKIFFEILFVPFLFFPFWNLSTDMGFRMMVNGTIVSIPFLIHAFCEVVGHKKSASENSMEKIQEMESNNRIKSKKIFAKPLLIVMDCILFSTIFFTVKIYNPKSDPPYAYYKKIAQNIELDDDSLLIAHLGLNHVYTYYKNLRDCLNWLPDFDVDDEKLWRIAYGADVARIKSFFPEISGWTLDERVSKIDGKYILIKEDLWQEYLRREEKDIAQTFENWFNPYQVRPSYIRKK